MYLENLSPEALRDYINQTIGIAESEDPCIERDLLLLALSALKEKLDPETIKDHERYKWLLENIQNLTIHTSPTFDTTTDFVACSFDSIYWNRMGRDWDKRPENNSLGRLKEAIDREIKKAQSAIRIGEEN